MQAVPWDPPKQILDSGVDGALDREIRELLALCFTKPGDEVFKSQRYFRQPPHSHWNLRDPGGRLAAHVSLYPREVRVGTEILRVGGIGDVCVHPLHRGKGLVRVILAAMLPWLREAGYEFSLLLGNPDVYGSSGFRRVEHAVRETDMISGKPNIMAKGSACVCCLGERVWPDGEIDLCGPVF